MSEETFPWILKHQSAKTWFDTLRAENTKEVYFSRLKQYCAAAGKNPHAFIAPKTKAETVAALSCFALEL